MFTLLGPPAPLGAMVSRIKGTPAVEIGTVEAPDAESAIREAIRLYGVTDAEHQKRLERGE